MVQGTRWPKSLTEAWDIVRTVSVAQHLGDCLVALPAVAPFDGLPVDFRGFVGDRSALVSDLREAPGVGAALPNVARFVTTRISDEPYRAKPAPAYGRPPWRSERPTVRYVGWSGNDNLGDESMLTATTRLLDWGRSPRAARRAISCCSAVGRSSTARATSASCVRRTPPRRASRSRDGCGPSRLLGNHGRHQPVGRVSRSCVYVGVRGPRSEALLREWGYDGQLDVVGDPALALSAPADTPSAIGSCRHLAGLDARRLWGEDDSRVFDALVDLIQGFDTEGREVTMLSCFPADDRPIMEIMRRAGRPDLPYLAGYADADGALRLLASSGFVIAERLHAAILAAACGTPFVGFGVPTQTPGLRGVHGFGALHRPNRSACGTARCRNRGRGQLGHGRLHDRDRDRPIPRAVGGGVRDHPKGRCVKVCMFVKNSFEYDARVTKEARVLISAGHDVTVVAIHVPTVTAEEETQPDGIHVIRISRLHLGLGALNRIAGRYAGTIEERHARLTGNEVDHAKARQLSNVVPASTATPGANAAAPQRLRAAPAPSGDPNALKRLWAGLTTPVLRGVAHTARFGFRVAKGLLGRQGSALKTWAINRRMIEIGVASGADVFHSHDLNTLYVGARCKKATGSPLVYDSHELATERNRMGYWWRTWATWNEKHWLPHADALIVASPSWSDWLAKKYGSVPPLVEAIINVPPLEHVSEPRDLRGELGIVPKDRILLYQGSIQENRGIEEAIEATLQLDDAVLVVVGYGYHRPVLERMAEDRGIGDRVKFFGPIPNHELVEWTAAADIGMCNIINSSISYYTSLPNKLFEYMMAGVAVIGSDSPEIGRIVEETGVGIACDPADPDAIAAAARTILANPEPYRSATEPATELYNWGVEERRLLGLYGALTNGSNEQS